MPLGHRLLLQRGSRCRSDVSVQGSTELESPVAPAAAAPAPEPCAAENAPESAPEEDPEDAPEDAATSAQHSPPLLPTEAAPPHRHGPLCFECGCPAVAALPQRPRRPPTGNVAGQVNPCPFAAEHAAADAPISVYVYDPEPAEPSTDLCECRHCARPFHRACRTTLCLHIRKPYSEDLCGDCIRVICHEAQQLGRSEPQPPVDVHLSALHLPHIGRSRHMEEWVRPDPFQLRHSGRAVPPEPPV